MVLLVITSIPKQQGQHSQKNVQFVAPLDSSYMWHTQGRKAQITTTCRVKVSDVTCSSDWHGGRRLVIRSPSKRALCWVRCLWRSTACITCAWPCTASCMQRRRPAVLWLRGGQGRCGICWLLNLLRADACCQKCGSTCTLLSGCKRVGGYRRRGRCRRHTQRERQGCASICSAWQCGGGSIRLRALLVG